MIAPVGARSGAFVEKHAMRHRPQLWLKGAVWLLVASGWLCPVSAGEEPLMRLEVDARDLPRKLLHSRITMPCRPGKLALWFPKWIPGTHAPCGPVENVGGLRLETQSGKPIAWRRDENEPYRIECDVAPGTESVTVRLDTICNKASVGAAGYLSYGNRSLAIINWSTCLLYPDGTPCDQIRVRLELRLPHNWRLATALPAESTGDGSASFKAVSLTELVDSPLIAGVRLRTIPLDTGDSPPAFLDVTSESQSALEIGPDVVDLYSRVVREAAALFGACHYPSFHFLVTCSDDLGHLGLEHLTCSMNGVRERDLRDASRRKGWVANLLPHEYVHAWCGKFRRPIGMCTRDFHTPQKTGLLWVYEGLAEYLGELLMVRSGLIDSKEYREMLAATISTLSHREGRRWRSLEDTAVASHMLRGSSPNWNELRREQDYYFEGALLWLETDALLRDRSQGKYSLNDFCRRFLGANPSHARVVPYDLPEIVSILRDLVDIDWGAFFKRRTSQPLDSLPLDVVGQCGYRLAYAGAPSGYLAFQERGAVSALDSLGLSFDPTGRVATVVPGMIGDRTGLAPGMIVIGVNRKTFSRERLLDALADSVADRKIEFLVREGEDLRTIALDYADGPRYLEMVRDPSKPDLLAEILKPIATQRGERTRGHR
jgi:predicted metalloprotease with PDZ domain